MKKRFTKAEKAQHWSKWKHSGLTQEAYCERHDLKPGSFKNWSQTKPAYPMVPVRIQTPHVSAPFKLIWNDVTVELPRDINSQEWQQVLSALREATPC